MRGWTSWEGRIALALEKARRQGVVGVYQNGSFVANAQTVTQVLGDSIGAETRCSYSIGADTQLSNRIETGNHLGRVNWGGAYCRHKFSRGNNIGRENLLGVLGDGQGARGILGWLGCERIQNGECGCYTHCFGYAGGSMYGEGMHGPD